MRMVKLNANEVAQLLSVARAPRRDDTVDDRPDMDGLEDETFVGVMDAEPPPPVKPSKRKFPWRLWSV